MDELELYKKMVKELVIEKDKQQDRLEKKIDYLEKLLFNAFRKANPDSYQNIEHAVPDDYVAMQEKYLEYLTELSKMGDAKRFPV